MSSAMRNPDGLTVTAEGALRAAGWFPGRQINCRKTLQSFESRNYPLFDAAFDFMSEYGDLHVYRPRKRGWQGVISMTIKGKVDAFISRPESLLEGEDFAEYWFMDELLRPLAGEQLCVVGQGEHICEGVYVGVSRAVYLVRYSATIQRIGATFGEGISWLVDEKAHTPGAGSTLDIGSPSDGSCNGNAR